jgi:hypothetical protein
MTFSKFDTQTQIEETNAYQPTAADLAEFAAWVDEIDSDWEELESDDGHLELYSEEFQLSAPEDWHGEEDSLGELSTLDGFEDDFEPEDSFYDYADLMGVFYDG